VQRARRDNPAHGENPLIVDDDPGFRSSARRMLEADGYQVVGEAQDGRSGIAAARALPPDIVLLDVHLPDLDGFEVAAALTCRDDAPVVVLTSSRDLGDFNRVRLSQSGLMFRVGSRRWRSVSRGCGVFRGRGGSPSNCRGRCC